MTKGRNGWRESESENLEGDGRRGHSLGFAKLGSEMFHPKRSMDKQSLSRNAEAGVSSVRTAVCSPV